MRSHVYYPKNLSGYLDRATCGSPRRIIYLRRYNQSSLAYMSFLNQGLIKLVCSEIEGIPSRRRRRENWEPLHESSEVPYRNCIRGPVGPPPYRISQAFKTLSANATKCSHGTLFATSSRIQFCRYSDADRRQRRLTDITVAPAMLPPWNVLAPTHPPCTGATALINHDL